MPDITLTFSGDINTSTQVGDTLYYCSLTEVAEFNTSNESSSSNDNITEIGTVSSISKTNATSTVVCTVPIVLSTTEPAVDSFILFSKDNRVNMASPLGYYAQVKFKNDSTVKGEMFSAACEIFGSSK